MTGTPTWRVLFDRASDRGVDVAAVRDALADRRERDE